MSAVAAAAGSALSAARAAARLTLQSSWRPLGMPGSSNAAGRVGANLICCCCGAAVLVPELHPRHGTHSWHRAKAVVAAADSSRACSLCQLQHLRLNHHRHCSFTEMSEELWRGSRRLARQLSKLGRSRARMVCISRCSAPCGLVQLGVRTLLGRACLQNSGQWRCLGS